LACTAVDALFFAASHGRHSKVPNALAEANLTHFIVRLEKFAKSLLFIVHSEAADDIQALSAILPCLQIIRDFLSACM